MVVLSYVSVSGIFDFCLFTYLQCQVFKGCGTWLGHSKDFHEVMVISNGLYFIKLIVLSCRTMYLTGCWQTSLNVLLLVLRSVNDCSLSVRSLFWSVLLQIHASQWTTVTCSVRQCWEYPPDSWPRYLVGETVLKNQRLLTSSLLTFQCPDM